MRQCSHVENAWHGSGLVSCAGDEFDGFGVLYACGVRLCSFCMGARRKLARRRAREGMARVQLGPGEKWFLTTLTMPTLPAKDAPLFVTLEIVYEAWRAFTKTGTWGRLSRASVKGVEFTLGRRHIEEGREWDAECDGYHVHIHLLAVARWIDAGTLRREWSKCLLAAWHSRGIEQGINTRDGLAVCHLRLVTNRKVRKSGSVISMDGAVCEVAKYITKAESFLTIPEQQLIEVAGVRRWPRMFELLGGCRSPRSSGRGDQDATGEAATDYLDTKNLSAAGDALREQMKEALRASRPRSLPLRQRGLELLLSGEWERWNEELTAHVAVQRSYRRLMLSESFPSATFRALDGEVWYGGDANPAGFLEPAEARAVRDGFEDFIYNRRDEIAEANAIEVENWEASLIRRDRDEWKDVANEAEDLEWGNFINGRKINERGEWEYDPDATNAIKIARKLLRDRYEDTELIRAILFSQGRQQEWFDWISNPETSVPDVFTRWVDK
jgi:hypothetical protein